MNPTPHDAGGDYHGAMHHDGVLTVIYINKRTVRLLKYAGSPDSDLSCHALAAELEVVPQSVGRFLSTLKRRGLIEITRGKHQVIRSITPCFDFAGGDYFLRNTR